MSSSNFSNDCGCGSPATTKQYGNKVGCGSSVVQQPPQPCCESHDVKYIAGNCLLFSCDVVAANPSFPISFSNTYIDIPIDANHVFFKHASAGFLRVVGVTQEGSYEVALEDTSLAGSLIRKNDCILIHTGRNGTGISNPFQRCLTGTFNVPTAPSGRSNIFIKTVS